jgi:hypothetical protein
MAAVNMVVLAPGDNVGVATKDIAGGQEARDLRGISVAAIEAIPLGHKVALRDIAGEELIIRFGVPVAAARSAIARGALVHVHNVRSRYLNNDEDHYE